MRDGDDAAVAEVTARARTSAAARRPGARSARRAGAPERSTARPAPARAGRAAPPRGRSRRRRAGVRGPGGARRRTPTARRGPGRPRPPGRRRRCRGSRASRSSRREERALRHVVARPARTRPGVRRRSPATTSSRVDLPAPDSPVTTVSPGPATSETSSSTRRSDPGTRRRLAPPTRPSARGTVDAGSRPQWTIGQLREHFVPIGRRSPARGAELGEDGVDGGGAVGGGVELGADAADRPVRLGRQQDREQPGLERHRPVGEPQPDGDGDDGDRDRGEQLERGRARKATRRVLIVARAVLLGDLGDDLDLAPGPPVADERREPAHDVEEVPGQRRERRQRRSVDSASPGR